LWFAPEAVVSEKNGLVADGLVRDDISPTFSLGWSLPLF
jgi:hypothetical protein